jgi:membrane-associated protein
VVLANPISPSALLSGSAALLVLAIVLFAECGLLVGFFLPGDTLLFAAGIFVSVGTIHTSLAEFLVVAPIAAILGNLLGYLIGYHVGPRVFDRPESRLFRPEYVDRAHAFFERFGSWTIVIGRFVPVVRTVVTVMAGVGRMRFAAYAFFSVLGAIVWADGVLLLGHALGRVRFVREHSDLLDPIVVAVVVIGLVPVAVHYLRTRRAGRRARTR